MATKAGRVARIAALWKRGWHEIPEVMASSVLGFIGLSISLSLAFYIKDRPTYREFRTRYTIYRDTDPRLEEIPHNPPINI